MNTEKTVSQIALDNGFSDSRAFAKAFKKRYGCLPSQYRKQMNQKQSEHETTGSRKAEYICDVLRAIVL